MSDYEWGIGTEIEIGLIKERYTLIFNKKVNNKFQLIKNKDNSVYLEADNLMNILNNGNPNYKIDYSGTIMNIADQGYIDENYVQKMENLLKGGIKFNIFELFNAGVEIDKPAYKGFLLKRGIEIPLNAEPSNIQLYFKDYYEELKNVNVRDLELLKTPTGKESFLQVLELATDDFANKTIDEHMSIIQNILTQFKDDLNFEYYNGDIYHGFFQKTYQPEAPTQVPAAVNPNMSKIVYIGRLGAIHLNLTMPTSQTLAEKLRKMGFKHSIINHPDADIKKFYTEHLNLVFVIQVLEPILMGFFGMADFKSFLDNNSFARTSARSFTNRKDNSPFSGISQFPDGQKLNTTRQIQSCTVEGFTEQYLNKVKSIVNYTNKDFFDNVNNFGCDINRRIEKERNQFFGFEIRNIDFNGHTDMTYYKVYIQFIFLLNYYLINQPECFITPLRKKLKTLYDDLSTNLVTVLENGFYGKMTDIYRDFICEILNVPPINITNNIPLFIFPLLYNHLFSFFNAQPEKPEKPENELKKLYKKIIGTPIATFKSVNKDSLFKISEIFVNSLNKSEKKMFDNYINNAKENTELKNGYIQQLNDLFMTIQFKITDDDKTKEKLNKLQAETIYNINEIFNSSESINKDIENKLKSLFIMKFGTDTVGNITKEIVEFNNIYKYSKKYLKYKQKYLALKNRN
jgi:hypothetical protein